MIGCDPDRLRCGEEAHHAGARAVPCSQRFAPHGGVGKPGPTFVRSAAADGDRPRSDRVPLAPPDLACVPVSPSLLGMLQWCGCRSASAPMGL